MDELQVVVKAPEWVWYGLAVLACLHVPNQVLDLVLLISKHRKNRLQKKVVEALSQRLNDD